MLNNFISRLSKSFYARGKNANTLQLDDNSSIEDLELISGSFLKGSIKASKGVRINQCYLHGNITIDDFTVLNGPNLDIYAQHANVNIGKFGSIARNVSIQAHDHNLKRLSTYFMNKHFFGGTENDDVLTKGDINIQNDVWIGTRTVILAGVLIGNGAIIGANSVVTSDVPDYAIAVGSPAKIVGYRFGPETIKLLLEKKWWDWPLEKIKSQKVLFNTELESEFVELLND